MKSGTDRGVLRSNMAELVRALAHRCRGLLHEKAVVVLHDGRAEAGVSARWCTGAVAAVILGRGSCARSRVTVAEDHRGGDSGPGHFAIVMLGTPTRDTSLTVIWNSRYNIWNASRFQRASGPVVLTA